MSKQNRRDFIKKTSVGVGLGAAAAASAAPAKAHDNQDDDIFLIVFISHGKLDQLV